MPTFQIVSRLSGNALFGGQYDTAKAMIEDAIAEDASLANAQLSYRYSGYTNWLGGANLAGADLRGAYLAGAIFNSGTNLSGTDLRGARYFDEAVTSGANLGSIITSGDSPTYSYPAAEFPEVVDYTWFW